MPTTRTGRLSVAAFLAAIVTMALLSTVFEWDATSVGRLNVGPAIGVVFLVGALIAGVVALVRDGERSWAVWISTIPPAVVLGAEVLSMLIPGE